MRRHVICLTYAASLFATSAFNVGATSSIPQKQVIKEKNDTLPELEVLSAKDPKNIRSTSPVHTINAKKILFTGITDISDAIHRLPGTNLRDYGGAGGLKTVSVRGLGAGHTAVIYDGIALSDCQSGQIDLSRYSLDNISELSLTIGDSEDIFIPARSAASSASLSINSLRHPKLSDPEFHLTAKFRTGSFGLVNPFVKINKSNGKNFSFSATADFLHAKNNYPFTLVNGNYVTRERRNNSLMNSGHAEAGAVWAPSERSTLTGKIYYYNNARQLPGPVKLYNNVNNEKLHDENFFGQIQYRNAISSKFSLLALSKFNWASSHYTDKNGIYPGGLLDRHYLQREVYASAALLYTPLPWLSADYSADWFLNNFTGNRASDPKPYRHSILQSLSAKISIPKLTVMARLLYSTFINGSKNGEAAKDANRLSPSVSLSYKPFENRGLYFRLSYKNIFRMPTFNEAYYDHYGSIELKPEITDQLNAGVTYRISPGKALSYISVTADAYMNHIKDKIVAVPYNLFIWNMSNLGKVRSFGVDATIESSFRIDKRNSILLTGNYSYQRSQPRTNPGSKEWMKQVAYTPLNSGAMSLTWENPWLNIVFHSTGTSSRYTTNANLPYTRIAGYIEAGAAVFRQFNIKKCKLEARIDLINMLDTQYEIIANYPMPGRSWQLSVKFDI